MKQKFLFFFLTAFLSLTGGGELWAASYIPSGTAKTFTATTDIIVAGTGEGTGENFTNSVIAAGKTANWITIPSESYSSKKPASDSEIDTPTSNVYCLQVKSDGGTFKESKRVIHFKVTGITGVKAIGQANPGERGFQIGATEYVEGTTNENTTVNVVAGSGSPENPVSCSGLDKSKTYIISVFANGGDTYLYAVRFISDPYESNISIANLCYAVGTQGSNSSSNGLDRTVGGFSLTFGGGDGVKYNGNNLLLVRTKNATSGTITIALDANNSKKNIKKVVFTKSSAGDGTFTASDNTYVTNSETTITWEGAACKTITFTESGSDFYITNIAITTDVTPVFEKVTPTVNISPTSASVKKATAGTFTTNATSSPKNFNWTWTPISLANVEYYTKNDGGTKTANQLGTPGTFETTSASTTTGNNTLVASFAGNDFFNAVATAATYTLTIKEPVASTPDNTVQTYPYTWDFANGSSTWGTSSTQLPISDWAKGGETYYNYSVPNSETGFNIDAIKGLRFQNIGYLGLDWDYGHVYLTGGIVIIPSVPKGMIIKINASNNGQGGSATITPINATYSGEGTATVNSSYQDFTFVTSSVGSVTFEFSGVASIKSISVQKNDLTTFAFNNSESYYGLSTDTPSENNQCTGELIGRTTTFKYKVGRSQVLRTRVNVAPGFDVTSIPVNTTNFAVSSNVTTVMDATPYSLSQPNSGKIWYWNVQVKKPGTASLTYRFNGTDAYNAKEYTELFTIQKDDLDLSFDNDYVEKTIGEEAFTNTFTLNGLTLPFTDDNAGTFNASTFTYVVKTADDKNSSDLVSVDNNGQVTLTNPGVVNIHVKHDATDYYNGVDRSYRLVVNPSSGTTPALTWSGDVSSVTIPYNDAVTHVATETTSTGQTIKYRSANNSIATVDAVGKVTGTGRGTTTIYAYIEPTATNKYAEITYTVEVTSAGELTSFRFAPNEGKVNNGKNITPKLVFPTIPNDGVTSLKVTQIDVLEREGVSVSETLTSKEAIGACDIISIDEYDDLRENWILNADGKVNKVNVTIHGKKVGKARITVTFTSTYYSTATATYTIEVTDASTRNFSWADSSGSPEYYTYAGDFMMLPAITGNSNGNNNFSNGAKNSKSYSEGGTSYSALHAYEYERKWNSGNSQFSIKWNEKDLKINEGFPDFAIVTEGISSPGTASVFFARGEGGDHPDTLMVYCEAAGDVKLRAYDPQDHTKYCDATIHILPISNIEGGSGAATTIKSGMTYPYTWDFTTNFDMANMVGSTDQYWMPIKDNNGNPTGEYTNGYGFFNLDWADVDKDNATNDRIYKHFIIGASNTKDGYMHQFNGMMLQMKGSTSWANRIDRMRILNYDGTNNRGRLQFIGGYHTLKIHVPTTLPSSFKIFVKASGTGKLCIMGLNEKAVSGKEKSLTSDPQIYSFDNTDVSYMGSEGYILLGFDDARVDWIAMSTEARTLMRPNNTTYAAATYSYGQDLDLIKSNEANGVTAYYASSFTVDNNVSAGSTTGEETQYAVKMKPLTSLNNGTATYVKANQGILLKKSADVGNADCYMIANPRNVDSYSASETITGDVKNYLVGTGANSADIAGRGKDGDDDYTNFLMGYAYKYYTDVTDPNSGSEYRFDRDWSFYPLIVSGKYNLAAQRCYLKIPGNLYVDRNGNLVEMPSSSRRSAGESAEAPATKAALSIVFDDDPLTGQGTTGISTVATETTIDSDAWYTLQGVRVETPTKGGIYIHKGRKIVVK